MASVLGDTSCAIHPERQSRARCTECRQFYCGECITEHEGQLKCAACLASESAPSTRRKRRGISVALAMLIQVAFAITVCWLVFYLFAQTLGDMPDDFHDGTIWE